MSNFYAGPGNGNKFGIYKRRGELMVDVLEGQFLLTYTTLLGTFHVVFEATTPSVLTIGLLEGDDVIQAFLQRGNISETSTGLYQVSGLTVFAWPGMGSVWDDIFVINPVTPIVVLVEEGSGIASDNVDLLPGSEDDDFEAGVEIGDGEFSVFLPAGDYSLEYTTTRGGPFQIVFRVTELEGFLSIPFFGDGEEVVTVILKRGVVPFGIVPIQVASEGIVFFYLPGSTVMLGDVFIINPVFNFIFLIIDGKICDSDDVKEIKTRYIITTDAGPGGSISPTFAIAPQNASRSFKIKPNFGFTIDKVWVDSDEVSVQMLGNGDGHYVFHHINRDHVLKATFK
jgi:hypothetical protein